MGRMSAERCDHWRGLLALEVVGQLGADDRIALRSHLDGCADCRAERAELAPLGQALAAADPAHGTEAAMPDGLGDAVVTRLRAEARRDRRRHRLHVGVLSGAAALVVALAGVLAGLQPWHGPAGRTVALSGPPGVHASVTIFAEPWGTRLALAETGQPGGQVLTVSMRSGTGRWWDAGTYRTVTGGEVRADFACAVPASQVYTVLVRDAEGHTVLTGETV